MDNITPTNNKIFKNKIIVPFVVSLIGILILIIAIFLPYLTAVGDLSEYIDTYSDTIAIKDSDVTLGELAKVPFISVSKLITSVWGEDDAQVTDIFLIVFGSFTLLTTLFIFLKKPILTMICDILTCCTFVILGILMREDFIGTDKYMWGIGLLLMLIAVIIIFIGSAWMLVSKIIQKKKIHSASKQFVVRTSG